MMKIKRIIPDKKICRTCGVEKPISEFHIRKESGILKNGETVIWKSPYHSCKKCHAERTKSDKQKRRSEVLKYHSEYNKKYYRNNLEKERKRGKEKYLKTKQ